MMQRDQHDYRGEETYVARPGETHIVRGDTHIVNERSTSEVDEDASPEEIRAEIEATRAEMSQTIDAIQEKLSPETLKEQALEVVREASEQAKDVVREVGDNAGRAVHDATIGRAEQFFTDVDESMGGLGSTIMDTIKQNPIPAALVGLGLGWLFLKGRSQTETRRSRRPYFDTHYDNYPNAAERDRLRGRWSGYGPTRYTEYPSEVEPGYGNYRVSPRTHERSEMANGESFTNRAGEAVGRAGETVGDVAGRAGETVGDVAGRAGEAVGDLANRAGDTMGDFADQARYRAHQAQGTFQQQILENPFAVGAVALGLGVAAGLAAPRTGAEDRLMGETRDKLMGQAHGFVREAGDKVQHFVDQAGQQIQEKAEDATWQAGEKVQESMNRASGAAGQAVGQAGSAMRQAGSSMQQAGSSVQQTGATVQREAHGSTQSGSTSMGSSSMGSSSPQGSSTAGGSSSGTGSYGSHDAIVESGRTHYTPGQGSTSSGSNASGTSTTSGGSSDPSSSIGGSTDPLSR